MVDGSNRSWLSLLQPYLIVPRGRVWEVDPLGYLYMVRNDAQQELLSFHWHPSGRSPVTTPHLHLGYGLEIPKSEFTNLHIPTGPVTLRQVVRFVITELRIRPLRRDWNKVLDNWDA
jgi:hypothetical protein